MLSNYIPSLLSPDGQPEALAHTLEQVSKDPRALSEAKEIFAIFSNFFSGNIFFPDPVTGIPLPIIPPTPIPDAPPIPEPDGDLVARLRAEIKVLKKVLSEHEYTSPEVAEDAARLLNDPKSSRIVKRVAASALTQVRDKPMPFKAV